MYLSATTKMHPQDAIQLTHLLEKYQSGDILIACASLSTPGEYAWIWRGTEGSEEGCGALTESSTSGIAVPTHGTKIFLGNRTPYVELMQRLPVSFRQGWSRSTFDADCRLASAFGLDEEQEWCQAAFSNDGSPEQPTAYISHVIGSDNYFGYFNIRWEKEDVHCLKSCHNLRTWANLYVPRMYAERDVERWVFLQKEDYEAFLRTAGDYRRAFRLIDFSFERFQAGHTSQLTVGDDGVRAPAASSGSLSGGFRATLQTVLSRLGMNTSEAWTSSDQIVVNRLRETLAGETNEPIDLSKAPVRLQKLKAVLLKRLALDKVPNDAPTRDEAITLYLELSRFYPNWDRVSTHSLFTSRIHEITVQNIIDSVSPEAGQKTIQKSRLQLVDELASHGINVSNLR